MTNEPSPRPWHTANFISGIEDANNGKVAANIRAADAALIVDAVNERAKFEEAHMKFPDLRPVIIAAGQRDAAIAECDRLRTAYADLWRAVKRIEAHSRIGLGTGLEVASSALHWVNTYASSAIRAAEKKGFAPAIGEDKP